MKIMKRIALVLLLVAGMASPAMANPVTVVNTGTSPGVTLNVMLPWVPYTGGALVGVENLLVDGVAYDAFCIDLYHFAGVNQSILYNIDPLASSPTAIPPGAMGAEQALFIQEMWAYGFATALNGRQSGAGSSWQSGRSSGHHFRRRSDSGLDLAQRRRDNCDSLWRGYADCLD